MRLFLTLIAAAVLPTMAYAQTTSVRAPLEIPVSQVDPKTQQISGPHIAYWPKVKEIEPRLLITIGGTHSLPSDFGEFAELAAEDGYYVLSVDYPNSTISTICRKFVNEPDCADDFRSTIVFGKADSNHVKVSEENSIMHRIETTLKWLALRYPEWKRFQLGSGEPNWEKIVLAGHSQGSGHAAYISKLYRVDGVILFSGPQDSNSQGLAPWVKSRGATPGNLYHALLHKNDFFGSANQILAVDELTEMGAKPVDEKEAHLLIVADRPERDPHNAVLYDQYRPEWKRLLNFDGEMEASNQQ